MFKEHYMCQDLITFVPCCKIVMDNSLDLLTGDMTCDGFVPSWLVRRKIDRFASDINIICCNN